MLVLLSLHIRNREESQRVCQEGRVLTQKMHGHAVISTLHQLWPWFKCWVNLKRAPWQAFAVGCLTVFFLLVWTRDSTNAEHLLDLCILSIRPISPQPTLKDPILTQIPSYFITLKFWPLEKY